MGTLVLSFVYNFTTGFDISTLLGSLPGSRFFALSDFSLLFFFLVTRLLAESTTFNVILIVF